MSDAERVEVPPFHQMGAFKWKTLGLADKLAGKLFADGQPDWGLDGHLPGCRLSGAPM